MHHVGRAGKHLVRRGARANTGEELDVVAGDERVELELPRLPGAVHGPHAADVARVVAVVGRGIHQDQLPLPQL